MSCDHCPRSLQGSLAVRRSCQNPRGLGKQVPDVGRLLHSSEEDLCIRRHDMAGADDDDLQCPLSAVGSTFAQMVTVPIWSPTCNTSAPSGTSRTFVSAR